MNFKSTLEALFLIFSWDNFKIGMPKKKSKYNFIACQQGLAEREELDSPVHSPVAEKPNLRGVVGTAWILGALKSPSFKLAQK